MEIIKTYHTKPAELEPFELKRIIQPFPAFPLRRMTPADRRELFTSKTITDSIDRIINPESFIAKEHYRFLLRRNEFDLPGFNNPAFVLHLIPAEIYREILAELERGNDGRG